MLLIAALVALFAYGRKTSEWSAKPFLVIAGVVAVLVGVGGFIQGLPVGVLAFAAAVDFLLGVAIFALGFALGKWLDRDRYA